MFAWAVLALLAAECIGNAGPEVPYKAVVRTPGAKVRSGPGGEHFVTQELAAGAEVEVHRVEPGGWLAIRPPEGSLSWVSADNASEVLDGVATVEGRGVASLVGSQFSEQRGSFQVVLEPGEPLEVIDEVLFEDADGASCWLMIAPPAGEFRWIAADDVRRPHEPDDSANGGAAPPPVEARPAAFEEPASEPQLNAPAQRQWTSSKRPLAPVAPPSVDDLSKTIRDELDALEVELSAMMADEPAAWHIEPLRERVANLLLLPHTPADARRALQLSRRLDRLADLSRRANSVSAAPMPDRLPRSAAFFLAPQQPLAPAAPLAWTPAPGARAPQWIAPQGALYAGAYPSTAWPAAAAAPWQPPQPPVFDAAGTLREVILPGQANAPSYALVDPQGRPLSYVSTGPGVDLRPYVGREVGLQGARGYDLLRGAPLVRADRVTLLEGGTRR